MRVGLAPGACNLPGLQAKVVLLALAAFVAVGDAYKIIPDRDVIGQNLGYGKGSSALDCAAQCEAMENCVAISWNAPASPIHDGNCNFKCKVTVLKPDKGEQAVVVRPDKNLCSVPPPPPPPAGVCDPGMPADWLPRCKAANLFYASPSTTGLMPEIANGYVGTIQGSDAIFAGGLFNGDATGKFGHASHRARIPAYKVSILTGSGGAPAEAPSGSALDVQRATYFHRSAVGEVLVEQRWYAHASRPSVLVHEVELVNSGATPVNITLSGAISSPSSELILNRSTGPSPSDYAVSGENVVAEDAQTSGGGNHTALAFIASTPCDTPGEAMPALDDCTALVTVAPGANLTKYFITTVVTSLNSSNPLLDATAIHRAARADTTTLRSEHEAAWAERWARGSVAVEGDLALAQAANASLYSLRASIRDDFPFGLSPGGLTTDGYNGHTFWDQETWMWPPLLMLDPPSAASALQYRYNRRAGAALKAANCGKPNHAWCPPGFAASKDALMFPWESAFTGDEVQNSGGKIGPWGEYEQHISGDISFAARQYFYATQDTAWLKAVGYPLIEGVAAFYAARVTADKSRPGLYDFKQVMGPDEYNYPVDNSRYTNVVASLALAAAVELAPIVGASVPADWEAKSKGLQAPTSPVPEGSHLSGTYHPEYDGYPVIKGPRVKQADTVMLSYPFGVNMSDEVLSNDLTWYEPHTDIHGPAMTYAIFAIGWFNTGNYTHAQARFQRGFSQNVKPPYMVWTETLSGGCIPFLTGAGGFLQSIVFGTSGMRLLSDRLTFKPPPPSATGGSATAMSLHGVSWRGARFDQRVTEATVAFTLTKASASGPLTLVAADGTRHQLAVGVPVTLPRDGGLVSLLPPKRATP